MIEKGICNQFKLDITNGIHKPEHNYKMALYTKDAELNKNTISYTEYNEVEGYNYLKGGKDLEGRQAFLINDTVIIDWTIDPEWPSSKITARGALIYNNSLVDKNAICVLDFGVDFTSVNGIFSYIFPEPIEQKALIRIP